MAKPMICLQVMAILSTVFKIQQGQTASNLSTNTPRIFSPHFLIEPTDVEIFDPSTPVVLKCQVNSKIDSCDWLQGGQRVFLERGRYELRGDTTGGDCSFHILQPQVGVDTTLWQCNPYLEHMIILLSKPARILVRTGTGTGYTSPLNWTFTIVPKNGASNYRKVLLDGASDRDTRIRWFIDGRLQTAASKRWNRGHLVNNAVDVKFERDQGPVLVQCGVEVKTNVLMKQIFTVSAFVISDDYKPANNYIDRIPYKVVPPKLRMSFQFNGNEEQITDNRVIIRAKDVSEAANLRVNCMDISGSSATYLRWGLIDPHGNVEITNDLIEFSINENDSVENPEKISASVRFLLPDRHINLQCQAGNLLLRGLTRSVSAVLTFRENNHCNANYGNIKYPSIFILAVLFLVSSFCSTSFV